MTRTELEQAMKARRPVEHFGIKYEFVKRIVLVPNYSKGETLVTAELVDKSGQSITVAPAHEIYPAGKGQKRKPEAGYRGITGMCAICLQPIEAGQEVSFRPSGKLFHQCCVDADPVAPRILEEKRQAWREKKWTG